MDVGLVIDLLFAHFATNSVCLGDDGHDLLKLQIDLTQLLQSLLIAELVAHLLLQFLFSLTFLFFESLLLLPHLFVESFTLLLKTFQSLFAVSASILKLNAFPFEFLLLCPFLIFKLLLGLFDFPLLLLLLLAELLFHLLELVVVVLIIDLKLGKLVPIGLFHGCIPIVGCLLVNHGVHVEIVMVVTNQNSVTVLQISRLFHTLAVNFDGVFGGILVVGDEHGVLVVAVVDEAALLVGDTHTFDRDRWRELSTVLADIVVTFIEGEFDHATHTRVLVDVSKLGDALETGLFLLAFLLLTLLLGQLALVLLLFSLHLREGLFLLFHLLLESCISGRSSTATTSSGGSTSSCSASS